MCNFSFFRTTDWLGEHARNDLFCVEGDVKFNSKLCNFTPLWVCDILSAGFLSIVRWLCRHIIYCGLTLMSWSIVSLTAHQQLSAQQCWTGTSNKSLAGTLAVHHDGQLTQSCFFLLCFNSHLPLTAVLQVHLDVADNSAYMYCSYPSTLFDCCWQ